MIDIYIQSLFYYSWKLYVFSFVKYDGFPYDQPLRGYPHEKDEAYFLMAHLKINASKM
jgi:hypothetical protein